MSKIGLKHSRPISGEPGNEAKVIYHEIVFLSVHSYKAVGEIDAPPATTLDYILPGPARVRTKWDKSVKVGGTAR